MIKKYTKEDENNLFQMIEEEGIEWQDYYMGENRSKYEKALETSLTYVLYEKDKLVGYCRCRDDSGYGIYVYDLLIDKNARGKRFGNALLKQVWLAYPDNDIYVMSDVDGYYQKQGFQKEGSIFVVSF